MCYSRELFFVISQCGRESHKFAHPVSRISISFARLRTHVVIVVIPVLSVPYAGNSQFSSLHKGDVGRDREIKLGLYSLQSIVMLQSHRFVRQYAHYFFLYICLCVYVCMYIYLYVYKFHFFRICIYMYI